MALTRPVLIAPPAFDATESYTFTFVLQGPTNYQIVSNTLVIRNNVTNAIVYNQNQETFRYEHIVGANLLTNGVYYNATITVTDTQGNTSVASVPIQFWCYTTPQISISNFPEAGRVTNATYTFDFNYTQNELEPISYYSVNLYDVYKNLVSSSGVVYVENGKPPYLGSYTFSGFNDNSTYYIEVAASTIERTEISTGLQEFTVRYLRPDIFTLIELTNNCDEGYITLKSNLVLIEGESYPSPPVYINDSEVDLRPNGYWVRWSQGYSVSNDFLARAWIRSPNKDKEIIRFSNLAGHTISIVWRNGYENVNSPDLQAYFEVIVTSLTGETYYIYSDYVPIQPSTIYYNVWLRRVNDIYEAKLSVL